jgi:multicomponent Na+:H+ antiporter subunit D
MPLLFVIIPLLGVFCLNLPKPAIAARFAPWLVGAICLKQGVLAVLSQTVGLPDLDLSAMLGLANLGLEVDGVSAVMLLVIAMVTLAANAVGFEGDDRRRILARSLMLACVAGMNGIAMVRDLFSAYVYLEIVAAACFVLIAIERKPEALAGAFNYYVLSGLATFCMLIANGLIFMRVGDLGFSRIQPAFASHDLTVMLSLVLYVVAFCVKAGVAPFHGWLPDAHASAPNAVSVMLSGVVIKVAGAYLAIRLLSEVFVGQAAPGQAFMMLGTFSIALGGLAAMGQTDMKRVLAFSSVSQIGYIMLAAGLGTPLAYIGAMSHLVNHAMFKSLLFVNAAAVKEQAHTAELDRLGGLTERMPVTGWTTVVGMLSAAGVPPLAGFWSKLLIIVALGQAGQWVYAGIALLLSVVTLGYFLMLQRKVFFGKLRDGLEDLKEARRSLNATSLLLASAITALGLLFPFVLVALSSRGLL